MSGKLLGFIKKYVESVKEQLACLPVQLRPQWFGFERHFENSHCIILATDGEVYEHHFKRENLLVSTPRCNNLKSNTEFDYKPADGKAVGRMKDEVEYFAHGDTLVYIRYAGKYFDVFYFAYKSTEVSFLSHLLNNSFILEKFARGFLEKFEKILEQRENAMLPEKMCNHRLFLRYTPGSVWSEKFQRHVHITKRELEASILSVRGKAQEEIAKTMNISVRTVETHLANAKNKLEIATKEEFIEIFFNYF